MSHHVETRSLVSASIGTGFWWHEPRVTLSWTWMDTKLDLIIQHSRSIHTQRYQLSLNLHRSLCCMPVRWRSSIILPEIWNTLLNIFILNSELTLLKFTTCAYNLTITVFTITQLFINVSKKIFFFKRGRGGSAHTHTHTHRAVISC